MGPDANGNYHPTSIKSIQRKRANVTSAEAGQTVSLALKRTKRQQVRKGMVMVKKTDEPPPRREYFVIFTQRFTKSKGINQRHTSSKAKS